MKSQGMQENQQVVFMSDGGENLRWVQEYLQPSSEHLILLCYGFASPFPIAFGRARLETEHRIGLANVP